MKRMIIFILALLVSWGCSQEPGPDALSSHAFQQGPQTGCTAVCHAPGSTVAPDPLLTNGTGTAGKHIAHVSSSGLSCDRCHFGYMNSPFHMNGRVEVQGTGSSSVQFDQLNSASASYTFAIGPPPAGICATVVCHAGTPMDWYGPDGTWTLPACDVCHQTPVGTRRQIFGPGGDFASNPSVTSHHVAGGADPASSQCIICHDQFDHMAGTVQLRHADTGSRIAYDSLSPSSLEVFCLGCHDADGAGGSLQPLADGVTLGTIPYVASTTIASSWTGSSVHRDRGLTCAGTGEPGTGCHGSGGKINMHGSVAPGLLANSMNFQIPLVSQATYSADPLGSSYAYDNYKLCFDCHAQYPAVNKEVVLGFFSGGVYDIFQTRSPFSVRQRSLFRDYYNFSLFLPYNDTMWGYPYMALHNYHLIGFESRAIIVPSGINALQWKYRGDPSRISRISCTACHNVHGSTVPTIRSTHEQLGLVRSSFGADQFTTLGTPSMTAEPMSCAIDCHTVAGQTSYWNVPGGE